VTIRSRHGDITTGKQPKHGFSDVKTLHALIADPLDPSFEGTEFVLSGKALGQGQVDEAKALFLHYAGDRVVGRTPIGSVLEPTRGGARIYVNGLRVATEDNFLFSYNITSPTKALRAALNRERSHVGRGAYTDRVKAILIACHEDEVIGALVQDLQRFEQGEQHDETAWIDVGLHACQQLNARRKVVFLTTWELRAAPDFLQRATDDGYEVVVVPDTLRWKLPRVRDALGNPMRDLSQYRAEWENSFQFTFVEPAELTADELEVWNRLPGIFAARGGRPKQVREVLVSETMRLVGGRYQEAVGVWEEKEGRIVVKRSQLRSVADFAGTVLHEVCHALGGARDVSLEFEEELTRQLGTVVAKAMSRRALDGPGLQSPESAAAEDYLSAAEQEVTKAVPDEAKLRAYSDALLQIALGAAGSGLWASIVSLLSHILGH
jgi:hypothetical protein